MPSKPAKKPAPHPLDVIRRARDEYGIRRVVVGVSCGKDSSVALALCCEHFEEVQGYFMFLVKNLSFQEDYLRYIERRFSLPPIIRIPHWGLSAMLRSGQFIHRTTATDSAKLVKIRDVEEWLRVKTGIEFMATGEKAIDSIERNACIRKANGIDMARRKFWPCAFWNHAAVFNYLKMKNVALPGDYRNPNFGGSLCSLWYRELSHIRECFPEDWQKIRRAFPLVDCQMLRGDNKWGRNK